MPYTRYNPELWWQVPSGEVSEVCGQLKETLVTSSSSSSSQTKRGDNKAAFTLQQDIGTMLYDGESSYVFLPTAGYNAMRHVASNCDCSTSLHFLLHIILMWPGNMYLYPGPGVVSQWYICSCLAAVSGTLK